MNERLDLNEVRGQIDSFFGQDSPGVKTRDQCRGNYDSYLRGVRQVEGKRKAHTSEMKA